MVVEVRKMVANPDTIKRALEAGDHSLLFTRGILENISEHFPEAMDDEDIVFQLWPNDGWQLVAEDDFWCNSWEFFTDGSFEAWKGDIFGRAGWSMVAIGADATPVARAFGAVWSPSTQR